MEETQKYQQAIQEQLTALETVLTKKDALLKKILEQNEVLQLKITALEKEVKSYSLQKAANSIYAANLPEAEQKKLLAQLQAYIKTIDAVVKNLEGA